jgi:hypothetical protein
MEIKKLDTYAITGNEKVELRWIGPKEAADLIARMDNVRKVKWNWVEQYCQLKRAEKFGLSNDAIVIDSLGRTRNGQHRLHMVVKTGTPSLFIVLSGVSPEIDKNCDQQHIRSKGLILGKTNTLVGAVRGFYSFPGATGSEFWPTPKIEEAMEKVGSIMESIIQMSAARDRENPVRGSPVYAALARASFYVESDTIADLINVMKGKDSATLNPASEAIRRLVMQKVFLGGGSAMRNQAYCRMQNAIYSFWKEQPAKFIRASAEDLFPITESVRLSGHWGNGMIGL